jgi:hypothetical protein
MRALLIALLAIGGSTVAHAATAPEWAAECAKLDDDAARLACYDVRNPPHKRAAGSPNASVGRTPAPVPPPASAPAAIPAAPGPDFGLPERAAPAAAKPADLVALVESVSQRASGELLLKLDNGQSWAQVVRNSDVRIKAGERVTIARGAFSGYLLSSDSGATMRVRRLQ